jgi:hypothetical protein
VCAVDTLVQNEGIKNEQDESTDEGPFEGLIGWNWHGRPNESS